MPVPGDTMYLSHDIIEEATSETPDFIMGYKGEKVKVLAHYTDRDYLNYLVEGPTNPGKPWLASRNDLMYTKPMSFN